MFDVECVDPDSEECVHLDFVEVESGGHHELAEPCAIVVEDQPALRRLPFVAAPVPLQPDGSRWVDHDVRVGGPHPRHRLEHLYRNGSGVLAERLPGGVDLIRRQFKRIVGQSDDADQFAGCREFLDLHGIGRTTQESCLRGWRPG